MGNRRAQSDDEDRTSCFAGRLEVRESRSGRREWPAEVKGRIVRESLTSGATVSDVARRHGLMPQQVTRWRRLAREGRLALPAAPVEAGAFAALVVTEDPSQAPMTGVEGLIEIVLGSVAVRLPATTAAARIAEIARALDARR